MTEDAADFVLDLGFGPMGVEHAEAGGFELASGPVEFEGGVEFLLRRHATEQLEVFGAVIFVQHGWRVREMRGKREMGVKSVAKKLELTNDLRGGGGKFLAGTEEVAAEFLVDDDAEEGRFGRVANLETPNGVGG